MKKTLYRKSVPYLFMLPFLAFFLVFLAYPIVFSLALCFGKYKAGKLTLTGLNNFRFILTDPIFYKALGNTIVMMAIQVPLMTFLALILASFLNNPNLKGKGVFRMIVFMPILLDSVSYSIVFGNFFNNENGLVNNVIRFFGGEGLPWLSVGWLAKLVLILIITWRWTGYNTVILLSGLTSISNDLYEAASIDGANGIQKFLHVTIPGVRPVLVFCVINSVNGMLQLFTEPYLLTAGGPVNETLTIVQYLYQKGFKSFDFGVASAGSYCLVVLIGILTYIQLKVTKEEQA
ncbi:MAG: sugar ABC transporter permease [Eubacteriales bacterium]|nr:sugar ABC transporter permease [Eubacteriales bacterium]